MVAEQVLEAEEEEGDNDSLSAGRQSFDTDCGACGVEGQVGGVVGCWAEGWSASRRMC
eukprot:COSAG02_NODE_66855_length_254_cov_0.890323_1_plen_57_part_01